MPHLRLDQSLVNEARALAQHIVAPVIDYSGEHTTVAIERATLRLIGVDGIDAEGVPLPNRVVDGALSFLTGGILRPFVASMLQNNLAVQAAAEVIGRDELSLQTVCADNEFLATIDTEALRLVREGLARVRALQGDGVPMVENIGDPPAATRCRLPAN